jgi:hypothetical protein
MLKANGLTNPNLVFALVVHYHAKATLSICIYKIKRCRQRHHNSPANAAGMRLDMRQVAEVLLQPTGR